MPSLSRRQLYKLDAKAVEELVSHYHAPLLYFITGFLGERADAEDVVSETVVKLLVKKPLFRNEKALKTYLYTTAKHVAIDRLRKQKREKDYLNKEIYLTKADVRYVDEAISKTEEQLAVAAGLRSLSVEYRQVLYLTYFEELSIAEIGKILGKSKKQIYNLLARAKASLAHILKKEVTQGEI